MRKAFMGLRHVMSRIPDVVVMKWHDRVIELRTGLRMMMFSVGVLAVLLACAGAEWDMYPGNSIQATVNAASSGDTVYVHAGTYIENVNVDKRVTLEGDGADVGTYCSRGKVIEDRRNYLVR